MSLKKYRVKNSSAESIEAEEIFLDAEAIRSIEDKGKMEQPIKERTFVLFYLVIIFGLLILLGQAAYLQIAKGQYFRDLAEGNKSKVFSLAAPRGIIYDRHYEQLLYNVPSFDLQINLADFLANQEAKQDEILQKLAVILARPQVELTEEIAEAQGQTSHLVLAEGIEYSKALNLEALVKDWSGLRLEKNVRRDYNFPVELSHIIGYTGRVSSEDLANQADYLFNDFIGKTGLELRYEDILRGQVGQEQVEIDSLGQIKKILATKLPRPGQGLVLNIDLGLQNKLYQSLEQKLKELKLKKAAAVAIDPQNGGILALVSFPSFDSNLFSQAVSKKQYEVLDQDPNQPLFNRVLTGQYPPGSTIKPLIAAAVLEEKIISPKEQINDQGPLKVVNQYNPSIVYTFLDWKIHGLTDIIKAIAESCNVFFYTVGGGYGQQEGLGIERIKKYLQLFGFGQLTGIDLSEEKKGLVPDKEWKKQAKQGEAWYIGDTYHVSIGQGDVLVTPLQMALATAVVANNGTLYKPQIVDKIVDSEKRTVKDIQPEVTNQDFISSDHLDTVRQGMRQAVFDGSAWVLADLPVKAAGKTGTAQFGSQDKTHAWFTAFAPYQDPEIVIVILIEAGGEGSTAAGPVAKEVLAWWFNSD